jgi:hypothetical protein
LQQTLKKNTNIATYYAILSRRAHEGRHADQELSDVDRAVAIHVEHAEQLNSKKIAISLFAI